MFLLSCVSSFLAVPAEAADAPLAKTEMQAVDRKSFGQKKRPGDNRPRRKARKRRDPYRGPFKKERYPFQEIRRPLVLPKAMAEIGLGADYFANSNGDGGVADFGVNVGIGDIVEVGVNSGLDLAPEFSSTEVIGLRARVLVSDGQRLDWAPGLDVGIPTGDDPGQLVVALDARHLLSRRVFLTFGEGAIPITLGSDPTVSLVGNVGLGVQASKKVAVIFGTQVVDFDVTNTEVTGIWEQLFLDGRVQVTPARQVDLGLRGRLEVLYQTDDPETGNVGGTVGGYVAARF